MSTSAQVDLWPAEKVAAQVKVSLAPNGVNYADSYRYVGFPSGVLVLVVALPLFGTLWLRAKAHR